MLAGSVLTRDGAIANQQARERIEGPGAAAPPAPDQATQEVEAEGEADENIPTSPDAPEARDEEGGAS